MDRERRRSIISYALKKEEEPVEMTTAIEWIRLALQSHSELALFLALAAGYFIGRLRIGSFRLGPVVGCLLAGVVVGQLGITIPTALGSVFFLLFLFSVGYKAGPQFFRGLGRNALPQVVLAILFAGAGLLTAYAVALVLGFDIGTAAGVLAGSSHSSAAMGTANDEIGKLAIGDDLRHAFTENMTVAFAVTYLVGLFTTFAVLVQMGPWMLRIDLRAECQKLEQELGMKKEEAGVVSAYKEFVMRAYRFPEGMQSEVVAELEYAFSPERVFVERVKKKDEIKIIDTDPHLRLEPGDCIVLSGRQRVLVSSSNPLQRYEIDEPALLDIPAIAVDHVLERKDLQHRTFAEIVAVLEKEVPTRGVFVRKVTRGGEELPLGERVVLERGDVLTLIGAGLHVDRVAERLGSVQRASHVTDLAPVCLIIVVGGLIGLPALHLGKVSLGFGLPVGVLLAALVMGWAQSLRPIFGRVPEPVVWLLDSLGLAVFVASIGINAGPGFVHGVRTTGVVLLTAGILSCAVPFIITIFAGRYLFRLHPGILLGICAGSATSSPALAALLEKAESRVPVLGYSVSYAIGEVLFALWGSIIVLLLHKS
jgi:putative transport protein